MVVQKVQVLLDAILGEAVCRDRYSVPERVEMLVVLAAGAMMGLVALSRRLGGSSRFLEELKEKTGEASPQILRGLKEVVTAALTMVKNRTFHLVSKNVPQRGEILNALVASQNMELIEDDLLALLRSAEELLKDGESAGP